MSPEHVFVYPSVIVVTLDGGAICLDGVSTYSTWIFDPWAWVSFYIAAKKD